MPVAYVTKSLRSANQIARHASAIMTSADGTRKAYGRIVKCSLGNGRFEPVEAWNLREKRDGKWETVEMHRSAEAAVLWTGWSGPVPRPEMKW